jgi:succinate dehydrogenase / fumarate reductase cytochrome b subunit
MGSKLFVYLNASVIKKQIMGVSGLLLCGFLVSHLLGNCLIYLGPEAFNTYAHTLTSNKAFLYTAEAGLIAVFLLHIFLAAKLTLENSQARPQKYFMKKHTGRGANLASATMPYTGFVILVFLILHILDLKFGPEYSATYGGVEMRDLYRLTLEYFADPIHVGGYLFTMLLLGIHVSHGFWSAFQSLGFNHPKYNDCLKMASKAFAVVVCIGFSALPIFCYLQGVR